MEVLPFLTPTTPLEAEEALVRSWDQSAHGGELTKEILNLLLSLWHLETGGGSKMSNNNFGNLVFVAGDGDWYAADDSGNQRRFKSFDSIEAGAREFLRQMTSQTRATWAAALHSGEPRAFVRALSGRDGGPAYFEADPDAYGSTFLQIWSQYSGEDPPSNFNPIPYGAAVLALFLMMRGKRK